MRRRDFIKAGALLLPAAPAIIRPASAQILFNKFSATPAGGANPFSLIVSGGGGTAPNGGTIGPFDTSGADLLVLGVGYFGVLGVTISDNMMNTFTALTEYQTPGPINTRLYYCQGGTVGAGHDFAVTQTNCFAPLFMMAFSGSAASPFDQENGNTSSSGGSSFQPNSITPSQANELVVSMLVNSTAGSITGQAVDSSFVLGALHTDFASGNNFAGAMAYLPQGAAAAVNPTWSWTGTATDTAATIASFK